MFLGWENHSEEAGVGAEVKRGHRLGLNRDHSPFNVYFWWLPAEVTEASLLQPRGHILETVLCGFLLASPKPVLASVCTGAQPYPTPPAECL